MYCLKCSAENPYDANFCAVCAYPITANFNTVSNARRVKPLGEFETEVETIMSPKIQKEFSIDKSESSFIQIIIKAMVVVGCVLSVIFAGSMIFREVNREIVPDSNYPINANTEVTNESWNQPTSQTYPTPDYRETQQPQQPTESYPPNETVPTFCVVVGKGNEVTTHINCDKQECDYDLSTLGHKVNTGEQLVLTGNVVQSSLSTVEFWWEVEINGEKVYLAQNKIDCVK